LIDHHLVFDTAAALLSCTSITIRFGRMAQEVMKISAGLLVSVDHGVDRFMTQSPVAFPDHPATDLFRTPLFLAQLLRS
jgi:hypothetical protein